MIEPTIVQILPLDDSFRDWATDILINNWDTPLVVSRGHLHDASKLPDFEKIEHFLGLAGLVGTTTEDGWYLEGFILKAENEP